MTIEARSAIEAARRPAAPPRRPAGRRGGARPAVPRSSPPGRRSAARGAARRGGEALGRAPLVLREPPSPALHRVDQVVGDLHPVERAASRRRATASPATTSSTTPARDAPRRAAEAATRGLVAAAAARARRQSRRPGDEDRMGDGCGRTRAKERETASWLGRGNGPGMRLFAGSSGIRARLRDPRLHAISGRGRFARSGGDGVEKRRGALARQREAPRPARRPARTASSAATGVRARPRRAVRDLPARPSRRLRPPRQLRFVFRHERRRQAAWAFPTPRSRPRCAPDRTADSAPAGPEEGLTGAHHRPRQVTRPGRTPAARAAATSSRTTASACCSTAATACSGSCAAPPTTSTSTRW